MQHLYGLNDIRHAYRLGYMSNVQRWRKNPAFPRPTATYGTTRRPLFDPAEVEAWVRQYRPEYVADAAKGVL